MNYAVEFYKANVFSLDNPKIFKKKVEEANKIEYYFSKVLPNTEHIRPFILTSYIFEKDLNINDRIKYIIGLVYASDYVDFDDLFSLSIDRYNLRDIIIESMKQKKHDDENKLDDEDYKTAKISIWKFTSYLKASNTEEFLDGLEDDINFVSEEDILGDNFDNDNSVCEGDNVVNMDSKIFDNLLASAMNNAKITTYEQLKIKEDDIDDDDLRISIEDKLDLFESKQDDFIDKTLEYKYKTKMITTEDFEMIKKAMYRWFDYIFTCMHDLVDIHENSLEYKNENIIKFL